MKRYTLMVLSLFIIMSMVLAACQQPAVALTEEPPVVVEPTEEPKELGTENDFRINNFSNWANAEITFEPGDKCTLKVIKDASNDLVQINILVKDDSYENYLLVVFTLDEGYTLGDLQDTASQSPPGTNMISHYVFDPGSATVIRFWGVDAGELYFRCQIQGPDALKNIDRGLGPLVVKGEIDATAVPPSSVWNPILATTRAKPAPPAAICPTGSTTPDLPGWVDQERPQAGPWSNQSAVFDHHTGRIIFVDEAAQTWTFDVCTNTWENMNPRRVPTSEYWYEGELVYDIDSDLTISFGGRKATIAIYDAQTNTWTQRDRPSKYENSLFWLGAVYDPVSGLVLVVTDDGLTAYDVETDEWTPIGMIVEERDVTSEGTTRTLEPPFLIGYVAETDRLAFLGFNGAPFQGNGGLLDPRTGQYTHLDKPPSGVVGGFGSFKYATGGATAYTFTSNNSVCRLDPVTLDWICHPLPDSLLDQIPSAMVIDTINDRLVLINNFCCNWPGTITTTDILALDLDTGEWTQLLAPSDK